MWANIDPKELPISDALRGELGKWAEWYDSTLNTSDPAASGFASEQAKEEFKETGLELARRLKDELGNSFDVQVQI